MNMRGVIAVLAAFAALATTLVAGAGAAGTSVPSGGNLVFAAIDPRDGMSDIYVQPTGGSAPLNITDSAGPRKDLSPVFAPSGSKIAFVRANAQGASIMVVNPNGTGLVNVTPLQLRGAINTDPSWSADGTRIVFSSNVDGNYDLYWIDALTGSTQLSLPHRVTKTEAPVQNHDPSWAPTGKHVVFSRTQPRISPSSSAITNSAELFQVEVGSVQAVRLTQTVAGRGDLSPVYAPNGLSIAFSSDRAGNEDVYLFSLTTKTVTALTNNPARDFEPAFAPDGTAVVYVSTRKGATELFAQNVIGLTPGPAPAVQMTFDGLTKSHPSWGATATHPGPIGAPVETPLPRPTVGAAFPAAS